MHFRRLRVRYLSVLGLSLAATGCPAETAPKPDAVNTASAKPTTTTITASASASAAADASAAPSTTASAEASASPPASASASATVAAPPVPPKAKPPKPPRRYPIPRGRPLVLDDRARTAPPLAGRDDWSTRIGAVAAVPAECRDSLADAWQRDAAAEHASVASFAQLSLELMAHGAPAELLTATHHAALDEIQHARACYALASAYRREPVGPGSLDVSSKTTGPRSLAELAIATFEEGCVGETAAALEMRQAAELCDDRVVRDTLLRLATDEERHAELAWMIVAWCRTQAAIDDALSASLSRCSGHDGAATDEPDLSRYGHLRTGERTAITVRAIDEVIAPCLQALLQH